MLSKLDIQFIYLSFLIYFTFLFIFKRITFIQKLKPLVIIGCIFYAFLNNTSYHWIKHITVYDITTKKINVTSLIYLQRNRPTLHRYNPVYRSEAITKGIKHATFASTITVYIYNESLFTSFTFHCGAFLQSLCVF